MIACLQGNCNVKYLYLRSNVRKHTFRCSPSDFQLSLHGCKVWSESSLQAFWIVKDAKFPYAGIEDWPDCISVQADM